MLRRVAVICMLGVAALSMFWNTSQSARTLESDASLVSNVSGPVESGQRLLPIKDVQLGQRVLTDITDWKLERAIGEHNANSLSSLPDVDQSTWRKVSFQVENSAGHIVDVQLLRPLSWLRQQQAKVGGTIHLVLEGLGVDGPARVVGIADCPEVQQGRGQVVTGKFTHVRGGILRVFLSGPGVLGAAP